MERLQFSRDKDNAKLKRIQEWSDIQRPIVYSVSLLSGFSCPSATDCQAWAIEYRVTGNRRLQDGKRAKFRCFSANQEVQYTNLYNQRKYNFDLVKKKSLEELEELIVNSIPTPADIIRVHVGGDFLSKDYMLAWYNSAKSHKDIRFYAYTKSVIWMQELESERPENFSMNASRGGKHDAVIDEFGMKSAEVVFHPSETDLPIDHNERHAIENRGSFALLLHGTQKKQSDASKALSRMNKEGIEYSYSK